MFLVEEASGTNFLRYKKAWYVLETGKHSPVLNVLKLQYEGDSQEIRSKVKEVAMGTSRQGHLGYVKSF